MDTRSIVYALIILVFFLVLFNSRTDIKSEIDSVNLVDCYSSGQLISSDLCKDVMTVSYNQKQAVINSDKEYMRARAALEDNYRNALNRGYENMNQQDKLAQINYYLNQ